MSAVNDNALSKFIGILEVAPFTTGTPVYTRMASVRGLLSRQTYDPTDIKADDTGTVLTVTKPTTTFEGSFLENADVDIMDILIPGTKGAVAASPIPVVDEDLNAQLATTLQFSANEMVIFANKMGDDSLVTSVTLQNNGVGLTDGVDFELVSLSNGQTGAVRIGANLALTGTGLEVDYTYTPNASSTFTYVKEQVEMPRLIIRITATQSGTGSTRIITLTDAKFTGDFLLDFLDVVENGDLNGSEFTLDLNDGGTFLMTDEINA